MPIIKGGLAVVKTSGWYRDLDSGEKDMLQARDIVRTLHKQGASWVVEGSMTGNALLVSASNLIGFKHPERAEGKYKPGQRFPIR